MTRSNKKNRDFKLGGWEWWESDALNSNAYISIRDDVIQLAMSRFKWSGLPETCDARFLEYTLLTQGIATICKPKGKFSTFFSTQAVLQGTPNIYDNPPRWVSFGNNGWNFPVSDANGVIIWDNSTRYPLLAKLEMYIIDLVDIRRTKQINRLHQKIPFILKGGQENEFDMVNLFKQVAGGEPAILVNKKGYQNIDIESLQTGVAFLGEQLEADWRNTWNDIYTALGIPNLPYKSERQIEDEVAAMGAPAELHLLNALDERRKACDKLNRRFDLDISVEWNTDVFSHNSQFLNDLKIQAQYDLEPMGGDGYGIAAMGALQ